jgi:hypothetical protein
MLATDGDVADISEAYATIQHRRNILQVDELARRWPGTRGASLFRSAVPPSAISSRIIRAQPTKQALGCARPSDPGCM